MADPGTAAERRELSGSTVLVTGAAGFIGSEVVRRLIARGVRVIGLDGFDPYYGRAIKDARLARLSDEADKRSGELVFVEADIRDPWPAERLAEVGIVLHLAARPGVRASFETPDQTRSINVDGTGEVVRALISRSASDGRPRRLVFASSSSVYGQGAAAIQSEEDSLGPAASPYAESKQLAEALITSELVGAKGVSAVIARLFTVYGPEQRPDMAISRFVDAALSGTTICLRGDAERDFTWVGDTARGLIEASRAPLESGSGVVTTVNLGTGRTLMMSSLIEHIEAAAGRSLAVRREPAARGDLRCTRAATERASAWLGWRAEVGITEGIRRCVAARRARQHESREDGSSRIPISSRNPRGS